MRLSGSPMLVTGLAEQDPRPKRIGPLTLPLASFGDPLIAGVIFTGGNANMHRSLFLIMVFLLALRCFMWVDQNSTALR